MAEPELGLLFFSFCTNKKKDHVKEMSLWRIYVQSPKQNASVSKVVSKEDDRNIWWLCEQ